MKTNFIKTKFIYYLSFLKFPNFCIYDALDGKWFNREGEKII
jgi:hypothetical protein